VEITERLTYRKIFLFWGPLALTWLMMAFEQPVLIAFIARLNEAKYNLAAFGIAGSFAMIVEAPIIMLMSASTALVRGKIPTGN
jgi:Na+-driven multidrug efflux pump